jgi:4'-phosphopantetheinyl transferase
MSDPAKLLRVADTARRPMPLGIHLYWVHGGMLGEATVASLQAVLSRTERQQADRFRFVPDRRKYVASHGALRVLLGKYLGIDPRLVQFSREPCSRCGGAHGKPVLSAESGLHFSISRACDVVLIGLSRHRLGVDLETVTPFDEYAAVARQFTPEERTALFGLPQHERSQAALRCWVRKEAYLKGVGTGLLGDPTKVHTGMSGSSLADTLLVAAGWNVTDVPAPCGYVAAVAAALDGAPRLVSRPLIL